MPIIRTPRTQEDIDAAWAEHSPTRRFVSGCAHTQSGGYGFVYLLRADDGAYKIGRSAYKGNQRVRAARRARGMPVERLALIPTWTQYWAEEYLHDRYADKCVGGEWFALTDADVEWICSLERLDIEK